MRRLAACRYAFTRRLRFDVIRSSWRGSEAVGFCQATLIVRTLFVIVLIDALERAAIDEQWLKTRLRARARRERVHAEIESRDHRRIHIGLCDLSLVDHLDDILIRAWYNANLINLIPGDLFFSISMGRPEGTNVPVFLKALRPMACLS